MKRGVTLVELLAAMAVLVVVAAIVLPVLARAKDRAIQATDISDMRQIGMAEELYTADFDQHSDGLVPLLRGGYLREVRVLRSQRDDYVDGASRKTSRCVGDDRAALAPDLPAATFFSYREAGILKWFYDQEIAPQQDAGWLVNPVRLDLDNAVGQCLQGPFQRLLWDGSVQQRHAMMIRGVTSAGNPYATQPLFSLFADPDDEAVARWYPAR